MSVLPKFKDNIQIRILIAWLCKSPRVCELRKFTVRLLTYETSDKNLSMRACQYFSGGLSGGDEQGDKPDNIVGKQTLL